MPKTRVQKEQTVTTFTDRLSKSNSVVFVDYKGLTMTELADLRTKLGEISAEFTITKNNLLKIALKNSQMDVSDDKIFEGPVATLFAYGDEIVPIKILTKAIKEFQKGSIKGGFLDGEELTSVQINKLSELPTKDELRAKVVGSLGAPLYGIVGVLQANIRNLVYTVEAIRKSKGGEQA